MRKSIAFTLIGLLLLPTISVLEHYLVTEETAYPKWDFYLGLAALLFCGYTLSVLYKPEETIKSFFAGATLFFAIHGFISETVPNIDKYDNSLVEKIGSFSLHATRQANAATPIKRNYPIGKHNSFDPQSIVLKNIDTELHLKLLLKHSNFNLHIFHDTLRSRRATAIYDWKEYDEISKSIPIYIPRNPDDVAIGISTTKNKKMDFYLPISSQLDIPQITLEKSIWGDFFWVFGFRRRQMHVSVNFDQVNRDFRPAALIADSKTKPENGVFLSKWDVPISSKEVLTNAGIGSAVIRTSAGHYLDPKFVTHIKSLSEFLPNEIYGFHLFDPMFDRKKQLKLLEIQIEDGAQHGLSTDLIVIGVDQRRFRALKSDLNNVGNDLAAIQIATNYISNLEKFIIELYQNKPNSSLVLYLGSNDFSGFFSLLNKNETPGILKTKIWYSSIKSRDTEEYRIKQRDFINKFRNRISWKDLEFHIPLLKTKDFQELEKKYQIFETKL